MQSKIHGRVDSGPESYSIIYWRILAGRCPIPSQGFWVDGLFCHLWILGRMDSLTLSTDAGKENPITFRDSIQATLVPSPFKDSM